MTAKYARSRTIAKFVFRQPLGLRSACLAIAPIALFIAVPALLMAQGVQQRFPVPSAGSIPSAPLYQATPLPTPPAVTANGTVVEDVIARINDQIITRSEYERARQSIIQEGAQQSVPAAEIEDRVKNLLRDMIDQQLLLSKGKELGITGDAETIRQLDEIRKQNHLDSMEALEKAATQQGVSYEDFKQSIRNRVVTQEVVRDQVGRRLNLTHATEEAYYAEHKDEFKQPEQVHLSEILVPLPETATDAQIAAAQAKADSLAAKLKAGTPFAEVAKTGSGGPTAAAGGDLGDFKRGTLGQVLEDATFSLPVGGTTAPIRTRQGFVLLKVDNHQQAGVPPLSAVEQDVQQAIYTSQMQPALRAYLTKARDEAYLTTANGFVDTGSGHRQANGINFTAYTAPPLKKKIQNKQRVEQQKAAKAQEDLAAARDKLVEKQAAKDAAKQAKQGGGGNLKSASYSRPVKPKKIRKEKIRYGQAPRNALPKAAAGAEVASVESGGVSGVAAGAALAPTQSVTTSSTGTGAVDDADPLAPVAPPQRKTRFAAHEDDAEAARAQNTFAKAQGKATTRPVAATASETATEKTQAAPLGLNGDTVKKKKVKREKGQPIERLQDKPKPAEPRPVAPTVNPVLSTPAAATGSGKTPPTADSTTLPPANQPAPTGTQQVQPVGTPPPPPQ